MENWAALTSRFLHADGCEFHDVAFSVVVGSSPGAVHVAAGGGGRFLLFRARGALAGSRGKVTSDPGPLPGAVRAPDTVLLLERKIWKGAWNSGVNKG